MNLPGALPSTKLINPAAERSASPSASRPPRATKSMLAKPTRLCFKNVMGRVEPVSKRSLNLQSAGQALALFMAKHDGGLHLRLGNLWQCWEMVLGPQLSPLGIPLGHAKDCLLIGAEDSMAVQELFMQTGEILERVNAFMDMPFFSRLQVELRLGRANLAASRPSVKKRLPPPRLPKPPNLGALLDVLPADSAVGKCYRAYLAYFARIEERGVSEAADPILK